MRSFPVTLDRIATPERLLEAWHRYRAGKRRRPAAARFELDAERHILHLSEQLLAGTYRPRGYRILPIRDPKARLIAVAPVAGRILHRALHDELAPRFERCYIHDTYACLHGRGSHRAVLRFLEFQRRYRAVLHLDIERFFPSVDHDILLALLARRLRDPALVELLRRILASGDALYRRPRVAAFYGRNLDESGRRPQGLPIGNLTSQWWANLYLDRLDHFVKRELGVKAYLRYMDDLVCFADEPRTLRACRREIAAWLLRERRLRLNHRHGHVRSTILPQGYLGYRITRQGYDLGPKAIRRFRKRLPALVAGDPERLRQALASWRGTMGF